MIACVCKSHGRLPSRRRLALLGLPRDILEIGTTRCLWFTSDDPDDPFSDQGAQGAADYVPLERGLDSSHHVRICELTVESDDRFADPI